MGTDVQKLDELRETVRTLKAAHPGPRQIAIIYHPCDRVKVDANEELTEMLDDLDLILCESEQVPPGELEAVVTAQLPADAERQPRWREAPIK